MKRFSIIAGVMTVVLLVGVLVGASNAVLGQGAGHHGKGFWADLTEEQRDAVHEKIKEMRSQDATREEIHAAVVDMLKGYGIDLPEDWRGPHYPGGFGPGPGGFWADLTDEQREAVHEKIKEMRSQDATREETHVAVTEMLKGDGIEVPEDWAGPHGPGDFGPPGPQGFFENLTEEQRDAIHEKIKEMRDQGTTREEIHSAVAEMLKGYGIEVPEDWAGPHGPGGFGPGPGGFWADLTDEQREAVHDKIKEMRDQGATREEIRAAVGEMLEAYGIELPEDWRLPHGPKGLRHDRGGFKDNLTDDQNEAIREKIKEMRSQGATRKEIRAAVAEMLKGYGIELPENWGEGCWSGHRQRCRLTKEQREIIRNLADEQRRTVRKTIREMRKQDATCEEIRAAVSELLEEYGIELPGDSESMSSETASAEPYIQAQSYPNPFNPETQISYTLSAPEIVRIQIYNVGGQVVRTFEMGYQTAGSYSVRWDGCTENGEPAASGIYLYRIEAGPYDVTNRMVLLK